MEVKPWTGLRVKYKARERTDLIVIHCSATKATLDVGVRTIDEWHRKQGWLMVGYHRVIRRDGTIEQGRADDQIGAHAAPVNKHSVGICMVGGVGADGRPENNFTPAQWASLEWCVKDYMQKWPKAHVLGHRDVPAPKACPSFDVREWLESVGIGNPPRTTTP